MGKYEEFEDCKPIKTLRESDVRMVVMEKLPNAQILKINERPNRVWDVNLIDHETKLVADYCVYQDRDVVKCCPPIRYKNLGNFVDENHIVKFLASLGIVGPWTDWFDNMFCKKCDSVTVDSEFLGEMEASPCELDDYGKGASYCPYKVHKYSEEDIIRMWLNARKEDDNGKV